MTSKEALYVLEMSAVADKNMTVDKAETLRNIIQKELEDFEYLKSLFSIEWFDKLPTSDKIRVMEIMGMEIRYE